MRPRLLGAVLLAAGVLLVAATVAVVFEARERRADSRADCAAAGEAGWCGMKEGYLSALALALGPLLALPGLALVLGGLLLVLSARGRGQAAPGRQMFK